MVCVCVCVCVVLRPRPEPCDLHLHLTTEVSSSPFLVSYTSVLHTPTQSRALRNLSCMMHRVCNMNVPTHSCCLLRTKQAYVSSSPPFAGAIWKLLIHQYAKLMDNLMTSSLPESFSVDSCGNMLACLLCLQGTISHVHFMMYVLSDS